MHNRILIANAAHLELLTLAAQSASSEVKSAEREPPPVIDRFLRRSKPRVEGTKLCPGTAYDTCGKPISANKETCLDCMYKAEREYKQWVESRGYDPD